MKNKGYLNFNLIKVIILSNKKFFQFFNLKHLKKVHLLLEKFFKNQENHLNIFLNFLY